MLERDAARLNDARRRTNICPLGSGALAGTAYKIDREELAKDLGFDAPSANSLDAVSDRDFVLETLAAASICAVHLSRLGEDLILYGTQEFAFVEFDDAVSSGSSLMPQKKNPDSAELLRGKAGRVIGPLVALLPPPSRAFPSRTTRTSRKTRSRSSSPCTTSPSASRSYRASSTR